jgi:DNA-binding transcriptional ArsR family regulator
MKTGILVLALFMLMLIAMPLAAYSDSDSSSIGDQSPIRGGMGHAYRNGAGAGMQANGMMQGKGNGPMPQAARNGQEPSAASQEAQRELQRDPFDWNAPARRVLLRGYRRLSGKNILEHAKRHLIYSNILMNPGIDISSLASLTGLNQHTLRYHLAYLIRMRKITSIEQGGSYHFFENHGRYGHADCQYILFQNYPTTNNIIALVDENPGITRGEIAHHLGLAGPSVTRWMHRLIDEGIVKEVREGRFARYYPALCQPAWPGKSAVGMELVSPGH